MNQHHHEIAERLVRNEVHACLSGLVSTLANAAGVAMRRHLGADQDAQDRPARELSGLIEQAAELTCPVADYESAAREAGWGPSDDDAEIFNPDDQHDTTCMGADRWQTACELDDIEPHDREVYEHWAISDWLADKLEAKGEKVDRDFAGLTVWARTTTGQAISIDAIILEIAADLDAASGAAEG